MCTEWLHSMSSALLTKPTEQSRCLGIHVERPHKRIARTHEMGNQHMLWQPILVCAGHGERYSRTDSPTNAERYGRRDSPTNTGRNRIDSPVRNASLQRSSSPGFRCYNCHKEGHMQMNCPHPKRERGGNSPVRPVSPSKPTLNSK